MFTFFKKAPQRPAEPVEPRLTEAEIATIYALLAEKKAQLATQLSTHNPDADTLAQLYEEMGLLIAEHDIDEAISYLETSLAYKLSIKSGYKRLMTLYNQKRAEAAQCGDDAGIEKWMNKMDDMRQIVKKVIITG